MSQYYKFKLMNLYLMSSNSIELKGVSDGGVHVATWVTKSVMVIKGT